MRRPQSTHYTTRIQHTPSQSSPPLLIHLFKRVVDSNRRHHQPFHFSLHCARKTNGERRMHCNSLHRHSSKDISHSSMHSMLLRHRFRTGMTDSQPLHRCWMGGGGGHGLLHWQLSGMYMHDCIGKTDNIYASSFERWCMKIQKTDTEWRGLPPIDVVMVWHAYLLNPT